MEPKEAIESKEDMAQLPPPPPPNLAAVRTPTESARAALQPHMRQTSQGEQQIEANCGAIIGAPLILTYGTCPICIDEQVNTLLVNEFNNTFSTCGHGYCDSCANEIYSNNPLCSICKQSFDGLFNNDTGDLNMLSAPLVTINHDVDDMLLPPPMSRSLTNGGISLARGPQRSFTTGGPMRSISTGGSSSGPSRVFHPINPINAPSSVRAIAEADAETVAEADAEVADEAMAVYNFDPIIGIYSLVVCAPNNPSSLHTTNGVKLEIVVLDVSGSMSSRINSTKEAIKRIIRSAGAGVYFTVLIFGTSVTQVFPPQVITGSNLSAILAFIDLIRIDGSTNLISALVATSKVIQNFEEFMSGCEFTCDVILLTDGEPDTMPTIADIPTNTKYWVMTFGGGVRADRLVDVFIQAVGVARVKYSACNTNCQIDSTLSEFVARCVWASSVTIRVPESMTIMMSAADDNGHTYTIPDFAYEDVAAIPITIRAPAPTSIDISDDTAISTVSSPSIDAVVMRESVNADVAEAPAVEAIVDLVEVTAIIGGVEMQIQIQRCQDQSILDAALEKRLMRELATIDTISELEAFRVEASNPNYSSYPCITKVLELIGTRYNMLSRGTSSSLNESRNTMTQLRMTSGSSQMSRQASEGLRQVSRQVTVLATIADAAVFEDAAVSEDA